MISASQEELMKTTFASGIGVLALAVAAIGSTAGQPLIPYRASPAGQPAIFKVHTRAQANGTLFLVMGIAQQFSKGVNHCDQKASSQDYNNCLSNALDRYAENLAKPEIALPLQLREVPAILSKAASDVRSVTAPRQEFNHPGQSPRVLPRKPATPKLENRESRRRSLDRARETVAMAAVEIRKDIALLEDTEETAEIQHIQKRTGDIIAASVESVEGRLLEAAAI
jgi:hypothetical protein